MKNKDKKRRKQLQAKIDQIDGYRRYCDDDVEIRRGKYGHGVYAVRQFLPGELVFEVKGQMISQKKYAGSDYVMEFSRKWFLEPGIPAAFLNHSCSANAELARISKDALGLVAICNIEPDSEVTFDYQWEPHEWTPRCRCGAPNCRGWVVAEDAVDKMRKIAKKNKRRNRT